MEDNIFAGLTGIELVQQKFVAFVQQHYPHCRVTANKRTELMYVEMCAGYGPVPEKLAMLLSKANEIIATISEEVANRLDLILVELTVGKVSVGYRKGELVFFIKVDLSVESAMAFLNEITEDGKLDTNRLRSMEALIVISYSDLEKKKRKS